MRAATATDHLTLSIAAYSSLTDTAATVGSLSWPELTARLGKHVECETKDAIGLWSPVSFVDTCPHPEACKAERKPCPHGRQNDHIANVVAAVLDHDDGPPHWGLVD